MSGLCFFHSTSFRRALALFFFFNDTATTEIYTLSLHDALPISPGRTCRRCVPCRAPRGVPGSSPDRKSTRLNQSQSNLVCRLLLEKKTTTFRKNCNRFWSCVSPPWTEKQRNALPFFRSSDGVIV